METLRTPLFLTVIGDVSLAGGVGLRLPRLVLKPLEPISPRILLVILVLLLFVRDYSSSVAFIFPKHFVYYL